MLYRDTTALRKILKLTKRIRHVTGGTSASKTISILMQLIHIAQTRELLISITSESLPHLKKGAMRDFLSIMKGHDYYNEDEWNRTNYTYTFSSGGQIEFFPSDQADKLRGPRRDILYINEGNGLSLESFQQLEMRTREWVVIDDNPTHEYWLHTDVMPSFDVEEITVTYKDNEALEQNIIDSIESRKKTNPNWYKVYGLGQMGTLEGQVYQEYELIDDVPEEARLIRYGLDFGYSNNPSALVAIYEYNKGFVIEEMCYRNGMSNKDLFKEIDQYEDCLTVADSAEPKSIDELKGYGLSVVPSTKGPGSVLQGIQLLQDHTLYVTKDSTNIIKELRNYIWKLDRDGKSTNTPVKEFDHAMDAIRYAITDYTGLTTYDSSDIVFL